MAMPLEQNMQGINPILLLFLSTLVHLLIVFSASGLLFLISLPLLFRFSLLALLLFVCAVPPSFQVHLYLITYCRHFFV